MKLPNPNLPQGLRCNNERNGYQVNWYTFYNMLAKCESLEDIQVTYSQCLEWLDLVATNENPKLAELPQVSKLLDYVRTRENEHRLQLRYIEPAMLSHCQAYVIYWTNIRIMLEAIHGKIRMVSNEPIF